MWNNQIHTCKFLLATHIRSALLELSCTSITRFPDVHTSPSSTKILQLSVSEPIEYMVSPPGLFSYSFLFSIHLLVILFFSAFPNLYLLMWPLLFFFYFIFFTTYALHFAISVQFSLPFSFPSIPYSWLFCQYHSAQRDHIREGHANCFVCWCVPAISVRKQMRGDW